MELAALTFLDGVDADVAFIAAAAGVAIHAPFAGVFAREVEFAEVDAFARRDVEKVRRLDSADALRVGVVEDPLVVVQVGQVTASVQHAMADFLDDAAVFVFEQKITPLFVAEPVFGLGEDVGGIAPDEVGGVTVRDDDAQITAIHVGGDQSGEVAAFGLRPAMQHDEALSIRANEQVVGVMFGFGEVLHHLTGLREQFMGDDEFLSAGFQIHMSDARARRGHLVKKAVADSSVAVAGATVGNAGEVAGHGLFTIGSERVNRSRKRGLLHRLHIQKVADELVFFALIPNHFGFGAGNPLQHATLLPAPCVALAQGNPLVVVLEVDHADLNHIIPGGGAPFKAGSIAQHKAIVGGELKLVVVSEPMKPRAFGDDAGRWEVFGGLALGACDHGTRGKRGETISEELTATGMGWHADVNVRGRITLPPDCIGAGKSGERDACCLADSDFDGAQILDRCAHEKMRSFCCCLSIVRNAIFPRGLLGELGDGRRASLPDFDFVILQKAVQSATIWPGGDDIVFRPEWICER